MVNDRITFFNHPKHVSRGEPYRHEALKQAKGEIVCYLCDRDLYLPNHVENMVVLLEKSDFTHSLPLHIYPDRNIKFFSVNLSNYSERQRMLMHANKVPLSCAAHKLSFYNQMKEKWDTTPKNQFTDWHMFKKFLKNKDCICSSGKIPTVLTFPTHKTNGWCRKDWLEEKRLEEMNYWNSKILINYDHLILELMEKHKLIVPRSS